ncbi:MAG: pseudouridine synthase [Desulfobacula sp. RIFOXYA12_FULL_46_16]|nr:MAG: pseudouridine synthase [Deltaproteobacteria bacterium RIFOXYC2_FULL_48_10]OGR20429.1 MAG: pseudouridine synthase [Desulfobacula sp. RIFOXYA12_FULL_46_16]OGR32058.1 MAG: pseudouridine synthase [Desulfobacula sp. RIFOXYB2_FULL_45_6]
MRLQKYLAHAGLCSRRKAEEYILAGRIKINGITISELGTKVDPSDSVFFDDKPVLLSRERPKIYLALNKPEGYVTSCSQKKTKIVMDLIDMDERIYPVGRLDKDSKGLILLTNDGELHNKLSHPSFDHEKEYIVTTVDPVSDKALRSMAAGVMIDAVKTRKATVKRISDKQFSIVLKEGRNRQIRKMVQRTGNEVDTLLRIRIANIHLGKLNEGTWRYLTQAEIRQLTQ